MLVPVEKSGSETESTVALCLRTTTPGLPALFLKELDRDSGGDRLLLRCRSGFQETWNSGVQSGGDRTTTGRPLALSEITPLSTSDTGNPF